MRDVFGVNQLMTIEKPTDLCKLVEVDQIPLSLTQIPQWICWRLKDTKKVPYGDKQCSRKVDCTDKKNWKSFDNAVSDYLKYDCSGIGFVLNGHIVELAARITA